ncbi:MULTISPECIES: hypothetical protein [Streptomyces]|uniref:hypothetical protein n=1 Tax=Streptomyces TaxID=1883 RepID=UPI00059F8022|nr:hypothetical protein [Streptomyces venezuelae]APE22853.1 hypothetical protein vnz_18785 [Streptomyces venezuelae]QES00233.1 hypothetical protein DEJ43_19040 [Streptomyces venezuelae ATCC 10712]
MTASRPLDWHGCLVDGQHRGAAIPETGVLVRAQVTSHLSPETSSAIDGGRVRTARDFVAQMTEPTARPAKRFNRNT